MMRNAQKQAVCVTETLASLKAPHKWMGSYSDAQRQTPRDVMHSTIDEVFEKSHEMFLRVKEKGRDFSQTFFFSDPEQKDVIFELFHSKKGQILGDAVKALSRLRW